MKKITQEDVDNAWKAWDEARDKARRAWAKALELERKFEEQEGDAD